MKTQHVFLLLTIILWQNTFCIAQQDTLHFFQVEGRVIDSKSGKPVVYADIILSGTNTGTISNFDGGFTLKISNKSSAASVVISSIGYENKVIDIDQLKTRAKLIKLDPVSINLAEIHIRPGGARELLLSALNSIRNNYSTKPYMVTAFYRESIRRKRRYVAVSEAVLDVYKSPYTGFDRDRIKILKARKSSDFQKKDTLALKLQGGPYTMFQLDFVKNPNELLNRQMLPYYEYKIDGQVIIDDKLAYVISFRQLPEIKVPLYEGKFYIEADKLAFLGAEFRINQNLIGKADEFMVKQKPPGVNVEIEKASYKVNYRFFEGKWHLSSVRTELSVFMRWKKKHFRSRYTTVAEMAVTDMDTLEVHKFENQTTLGMRDVLIEQVGNFEDPEFWGAYNIIRPEESIQSAIKRMGRKLRRKNKAIAE